MDTGSFPHPQNCKKYGKPETLHLDGTWNSEGSRSMAFHGSIRFLCGWKAMLVTLLIVSLEIWKLDTPTKTKTQKVTVYLFFTNFRKLFGPLWQVNIAIAGISPFFNRKYIFKWSIFQPAMLVDPGVYPRWMSKVVTIFPPCPGHLRPEIDTRVFPWHQAAGHTSHTQGEPRSNVSWHSIIWLVVEPTICSSNWVYLPQFSGWT